MVPYYTEVPLYVGLLCVFTDFRAQELLGIGIALMLIRIGFLCDKIGFNSRLTRIYFQSFRDQKIVKIFINGIFFSQQMLLG
jgi:hypothetical protein